VIVFNGAAANNVDHITFMEIKSEKARLNKHQRMIRDAIKDNNVKVEAI
jgi:predicted Holliday junction resolvase-like endonuclease